MRETGKPVSALGNELIGALAYGGTDAILEALTDGADIVLTQRAGNSEQFVAPMMHEFGWRSDEWDKIGSGLGIGHLLECGAQITGGYFADPGRKDVTGLHRLGFPIAEVEPDGSAIVTKLQGTGGVVNEQTCKEQLLYEIGDPARYVHAPGVVDFTTTTVTQVAPDRVRDRGDDRRTEASDRARRPRRPRWLHRHGARDLRRHRLLREGAARGRHGVPAAHRAVRRPPLGPALRLHRLQCALRLGCRSGDAEGDRTPRHRPLHDFARKRARCRCSSRNCRSTAPPAPPGVGRSIRAVSRK